MPECKCSENCAQNSAKGFVFACAGGSNVGSLSYDLARELHQLNRYNISCASGVGADICGFKDSVDENSAVSLLIDGCPVSCLKTMFDNKGITNYKQIILTDLSVMKKPDLNYDKELLDRIVQEIINPKEGL